MPGPQKRRSGGIPRGLATTGPVLFSYGFRPFFLGAALMAIVAMALWILALTAGLPVGGSYGAAHWHAHEMLFGFAPAVVAGFLLTSVPNWTGRLPVAGRPLMALFGLWVVGRIVLLQPDLIGIGAAAVLDGLFLPALLLIFAREIVAGRKWKDLKVLVVLAFLSAANIGFHLATLTGEHGGLAQRLAVSAYVVLIMIMGGRIIPSFSRNWLNQRGEKRFPIPFNTFDTVAIAGGAVALGGWTLLPENRLTGLIALSAFCLHVARLVRWRGHAVFTEKLLFVLHLAYAFIPLGLLAIALGTQGYLADTAVLHVLTVGAMATMMLAVMARATRGHTGRVLAASPMTTLSYVAILLAALLRPAADLLPGYRTELLTAAGLFWIAAFALFVYEYGPMLARVRRVAIG
ncbi:MAG: NnrS family protein [Arenimonas sp.]|nr:NnrS family protein [Rhizobium sp.]MBW8447872.1 NnrS family protein [Arenimonas sp.]